MLKNGKVFAQIAQGSMKLHFTFIIVSFRGRKPRYLMSDICANMSFWIGSITEIMSAQWRFIDFVTFLTYDFAETSQVYLLG